jgi:hypothetical protein
MDAIHLQCSIHALGRQLQGNKLFGTLPLPWLQGQGLRRLRLLDVSNNSLHGALPAVATRLPLHRL